MKALGLLDRLDDAINPIVIRELRQSVQSRLVVIVFLLFLAIQMCILGGMVWYREWGSVEAGMNFRAGRDVFTVLQAVLLVTCMLLIPAYTGTRLALERADGNTDLLFISTLRPWSIVWGKLFAAGTLTVLLFSACAPFMTFTYLLRGLDMPTITMVLLIDLLTVLLATQLTIFLGAIPAHWVFKIFLGLLTLVLFGFGTITAVAGTGEMVYAGLGLSFDDSEFWQIVSTAVLATVGVVGLIFTWSVVLVTPPTANRAPLPRLYLLAAWLASGAIVAGWSYHDKDNTPVVWWMGVFMGVLSLQLFISASERDRWTPRVARTIPRRWWLRAPAFLFYSGSAGGVAFTVLLMGLTMAAFFGWRDRYEFAGRAAAAATLGTSSGHALGGWEWGTRRAELLALVALYTYAYTMTAVVVRAVLSKVGRLPTGLTWFVALLLLGVGSAVPYLIVWLFFTDEMRFHTGLSWWAFPNPFAACMEVDEQAYRGSAAFHSDAFLFVTVWSLLATAAGMFWFVAQVKRFRPLKRVPPSVLPTDEAPILDAVPAGPA